MKKLFAMFLALAMIMSLSIAAFAEEGVGVGSYNTDVTGNYVAGTTGNGTVFSVDITWSAMSFTYHAEKAPVWDVETHTYSESVPAYWEGEGTITVTNHSNAKISAVPAYTAAEGFESADLNFSTTKLKIASAESGKAETGTITVTPDGMLPENTNNTKIGTISVTIGQDFDITVAEAEELLAKMETLENEMNQLGADYVGAMTGLDSKRTALQTATDAIKTGGNFQEELNTKYSAALDEYNTCYEMVHGN